MGKGQVINSDAVQEINWHKAATLIERIAGLHAHGRNIVSPKNMARAQRKLAKWKAQSPFQTKDYFARRLAMDGTTEEELFCLFETDGIFDSSPLWANDLAQAFAASNSSSPSVAHDLPYFQESAGFLTLIQCVIDQAVQRLRTGITKLKGIESSPFDAEVVPSMLSAGFSARLLAMLNRTMVLELNVARLEDNLQGDSSEERFQSFILRLQNKEIALDLLREYPVLARQIMIRADQWVAFSQEFLQSLCSDWAAIRTTFFPDGDPGPLVEVKGAMGDQHRNGRSVLVCKFSSGAQLVYKPRPLSLDKHFQELLIWVNQFTSLDFRRLKILDRGSYGWVEFVEPAPCNSQKEIQRFYERQGGYLALLFAMEASDFHFENVIAAGEHPVLIDLEAMFHPRFEVSPQAQANESITSALNYSVLRVGLLPQRVFGDNASPEAIGIDTSGLGGSGGQLTLEPVPWLEAAGTDAMHIASKRVMMLQRENRPSLPDAEIKVQDYGDAIVAGFTAVYETLLRHREELLSHNGLLSQFADDQVRVVLRPTEVYALLLRESFHPDFLRDALDRDRFLDYLWAAVPECPQLEKVIASERHDLLHGDIPIFTTRPSSCDLWNSADQSFEKFLINQGLSA
jgi:type 2 lantibiotic biosynthesis protein LanM